MHTKRRSPTKELRLKLNCMERAGRQRMTLRGIEGQARHDGRNRHPALPAGQQLHTEQGEQTGDEIARRDRRPRLTSGPATACRAGRTDRR